MALQQGKRAAVRDNDVSMPVAKRVCLERTESAAEDTSSGNEPASTSPPSSQSSVDGPATITSITARSTSKRPKKYICEYEGCGKAFDRPVRLQAHVRTHTNDRPFICDEEGCTKSFFKSEHLKAHVQNKHSNEANHVCHYVLSINETGEEFECGKAFTTSTRLRRHTAIHEKAEELKCREVGCGQVFRKMETLQRHIKQEHLHEKAFRCAKTSNDTLSDDQGEECGQTFSTAAQLKAHENREHAGMRYFCSICSPPEEGMTNEPIGFQTYSEYQIHLRIFHPPTCTVCNKQCESNRALTAHMEIEHSTLASRQQRYRCDHPGCGRGFTRKGNLNVHVQSVHNKKRDFVCGATDLSNNEKCPSWDDSNGCGSAFTTKASLENHVRTQHLQLLHLYHPRKSAKENKRGEGRNNTVDFDEQPYDAHDMFDAAHDALGLLTGSNYADTRPIACWVPNCQVRFGRTSDLVYHLEFGHGWETGHVQERLTENNPIHGGQLHIRGPDETVHEDEMIHDNDEMPLAQALSLADYVPQEYWFNDENETHCGRMPSVPKIGQHSDINMVLDPMLAE